MKRELLVGTKTLPYEALFVVGRVWYKLNTPYAVPKFIAVVRDKYTKELKQNLTEEELAKLEKEISERFYWQAKVIKLEDLEKEIEQRYKEELLKAKEEGKIIFSYADTMFNRLAELINKKDPLEFEI